MLTVLVGCDSLQPLNVDVVENSLPTFNPQPPNPIVTNPVNWQVLNNDSVKKLCTTNDPNFVLYGLDPQSFTNNLLNLQDSDRYIEQQNLNVQFYQNYNNSVSQANPAPVAPPPATTN